MRLIARTLSVFLGASIAGWISFSIPATASAAESQARTHCKAKNKKREKAKKAKPEAKVVNVRAIVDWYRAGIDADEIVARAEKASYVASKRDQKKLEERHLPKDLVLALAGKKTLAPKTEPEEALDPEPKRTSRRPLTADGDAAPEGEVEVAEAKPAKKGIDLGTIDPNSIDFDSVPPPEGVRSEPAGRTDKSPRPDESTSAPKVDPKKSAQKPTARRPIVASP